MHVNKATLQTMAIAAAMVVAGTALAGTGGDTFDSVWITLTEWMQGTLGRILIGLMILTGIGALLALAAVLASMLRRMLSSR
jgi:conjugal transfer pilus assembly protein TraA